MNHRKRWRRCLLVVLVLGGLSIQFRTSAATAGTSGTAVSNPIGASQSFIAPGTSHTCALITSGAVNCWGRNEYGQLGNGTNNNSSTPTVVSGLSSGVSAITAGNSHTCGLLATGAVKCWGYNFYGQLGVGTNTDANTPTVVSGLSSGVTAVDAGNTGYHTCVLLSSGAVECWGQNMFGQLGDGTTTDTTTPIAVSGLSSGVTAIAVGGYHTCALLSTGAVKCWGYNVFRQLGDGTNANANTPTAVSGLSSGVSAITAGNSHTCAVLATGAVTCWGRNFYGQLGDGTNITGSTPTAVSGLSSGVIAIAAGNSHTCAVLATGAVTCWGLNFYGQLGDGTNTNANTPTPVSGLSTGVGSPTTTSTIAPSSSVIPASTSSPNTTPSTVTPSSASPVNPSSRNNTSQSSSTLGSTTSTAATTTSTVAPIATIDIEEFINTSIDNITTLADTADSNNGAAVLINGEATTVDIATTTTSTTLSYGNASLEVTCFDAAGHPIALSNEGRFTLHHGDSVSMTATGFAPGSQINVAIFSDPVALGTATTNSNGLATQQWSIPDSMTPGDHTLVFSGDLTDVKDTVFGLRIVVNQESFIARIASNTWARIIVALGIASGLLIPANRRRRRTA